MAMSEMLDGAIKLFRANIATLAIIVATIALPLDFLLAFFERDINGGHGILQTLNNPSAPSSQSNPSTTLAITALGYVVFWVVLPFVCAAACRVVMASYFGGQLKGKDALSATFKHAPALLAATLMVHLAEVIGLVGLLVGSLFLMPLFMMTAPAISLEDLGPVAGIRRSVTLAERRYWPTLAMALASGGLALFLNWVIGLVPNTVALFIGLRWGWLIIGATSVVQSVVSVSLITIVTTLVYLDARMRQEGLDLQVLAARSEPPAVTTPMSSW
jgi:hypothetical protein